MNPKIKFITAVGAFGTIGYFVKNISLPSAEIALYRAIIAFLFLCIYLIASKGFFQLYEAEARQNYLKFFITGAAMGFNWILLFEAYNYTTVALATLSYYFAPVIVVILSFILFKEKLTVKQIILFAVSTAGLVLITGVSKGQGSNHLLGIGLGLSAAVLYAFVILINKSIKGTDDIVRTVMQFAAAIIVLIPYTAANTGFNFRTLDAYSTMNLLIIGVFHTGITYYLYFSSLQYIKGQEAAILSYIDPLIAVIISVALLGESIAPLQLAGGGIILFSTLMNELTAGKKVHQES